MRLFCHRCHGDLPDPDSPGAPASETPALFCPHCGAPQLRLAESARNTVPSPAIAGTGTPPPPHPGRIDWPVALRAALPIAAIAALLKLLAFVSQPISLLSDAWVAFASLLALSLYARRRPSARLSSQAGLRIGLMTGVLQVAAIGCALAAAGIILRFGLGRAAPIDAAMAAAIATMHQGANAMYTQQSTPADVQATLNGWIASPEMQAGATLSYLAFRAAIVLVFAAAGGALAGSMRHPRPAIARPSR